MNYNCNIREEKLRKRPLKSEVNKLLSNNKKAMKLLKWKPKFVGVKGFEKGLLNTIEWFKTNNKKFIYKNIYTK